MYWYNQDIDRLENKEVKDDGRKKIVFYGSSTFTLWKSLESSFPNHNVINLGFGGSTLAACAWFFHRVIPRQKPDAIFIYAGDNDLGDGRTPEEVILFYYQLIAHIRQSLGNIPVCFISIKLSPVREYLRGSIEYTNHCIKYAIENSNERTYFLDLYSLMLNAEGKIKLDLFEEDGLHLSAKGYALWHEEILKKSLPFF